MAGIGSPQRIAREASICDLTEAERQYLVKTRALTRDEEGETYWLVWPTPNQM